jgi:hypothetical protein
MANSKQPPRPLTSAEVQAGEQPNGPDEAEPSDAVPGADREMFGDRSQVDATGAPVMTHHGDSAPASPTADDLEQAKERAKARRDAVKNRILAADVVTADPVTGEPTILVAQSKVSDLPEHWQPFLAEDGREHLFEPDPLAPGQFETGDRAYFKVVGGPTR